MSKNGKKKRSPLLATTTGGIAGGIETMVVWPMEYIKTQLQLASKSSAREFENSILSCARYTLRTKGFLTFYDGMAPVLLGAIPKAGIRFGGFNEISRKFQLPDGSITPMRTLAAGSIAGAVEAAIIVTPVETLKTRLIHSRVGFLRGSLDILKKEGPRGIYRGAVPTIMKQGSNQGLRFMAFGQYKRLLGKQSPNPLESFFGGMFAGCFSTLCNNPADMLKTRMQGNDAGKYNGFVDCARKVVKEEGVLTLWSGTTARLGAGRAGAGRHIHVVRNHRERSRVQL